MVECFRVHQPGLGEDDSGLWHPNFLYKILNKY